MQCIAAWMAKSVNTILAIQSCWRIWMICLIRNTAPLLKLIVPIRFIQSWVCLESVQMNNFHFAFRTALDSVHDLVYPFYHFLPLRIKQSNFIILLALMNVQQFFLKLVNVILNVLALACWKSKDNITCKSKFSTKQKFRWWWWWTAAPYAIGAGSSSETC